MAIAFVEFDPNAYSTPTQVRDAIVNDLADADRKIVLTRPSAGEYPVYAVQITDPGKKAKVEYDTVPA